MELRYLVSFLALAEELHFGRAAAKLHLTQPSLSQQLQRLERRLGIVLVTRSSHEVRLTPAGEAFREHARAIVEKLDRATRAARASAEGRSGTIRVGYNLSAWRDVLPRVLSVMHARFPEIVVELSEQRSGAQLAALREGELDVAFAYDDATEAELSQRRLMRVPIVALVGVHHPWAERRRVDFAELAGQQCVLFAREQSPAMYDTIVATAENLGVVLDVGHRVDDLGATAIVVATRPVVAFVSAHRGEHESAGGLGSVAVAFAEPAPTVDLRAVWRVADNPSPVQAFLACLDDVCPTPVASD